MLRRALIIICLLASPARADLGSGADGTFSERRSSHFQLLQDVDIDRSSGLRGSRRFEQDVLKVLESAYAQLGDQLSIRPRTRFSVLIYDAAVFDARFGGRFGFRAAGFFDGAVHVRGSTRVDGRLVGTLHHEYTHAALDWEASGLFPAWLNEGLAEYFEARGLGHRHLTQIQYAQLVHAAKTGQWIPLRALSQPSFTHLGEQTAALAYLESYAVIEHLVRQHGMRDLRSLVERVVKMRNVDRALDRTYKRTLEEIEAELLAELR